MTVQTLLEDRKIKKTEIDTIQINIGDRCNQACAHCHIGASPAGSRNMDYETASGILDKLLTLNICNIEFTGGTPELNPNFKMLVEGLAKNGKRITVRTSLTVLALPEYAVFMDIYKKHMVRLVASLPSISEDRTDKQRGKGVFRKTIEVLKKLNSIGYGTGELTLDLVHNPVDDCLPLAQTALEKEYREFLKKTCDISFNNLITIVNSPVKRFRDQLVRQGRLGDYMQMLVDNFNPETLEKIMCRHQISVDYQGFVYDCDFNLALGIRIKGYEDRKFRDIDFNDFNPEITCEAHCYACTAGRGSSCHGSLIKDIPLCPIKINLKGCSGSAGL